MEFTVTTDVTGGVAVYLGADGRLTDGKGQVIFTDRVFADAMDAEFFLVTDGFANFMRAYIAAPYWREYVESNTL